MQQVAIRYLIHIAQRSLLAQATDEHGDRPPGGQSLCHMLHIGGLLPRNAKPLFEREHQQIAVVIYRANGHARAAHNTLMREASYIGRNWL